MKKYLVILFCIFCSLFLHATTGTINPVPGKHENVNYQIGLSKNVNRGYSIRVNPFTGNDNIRLHDKVYKYDYDHYKELHKRAVGLKTFGIVSTIVGAGIVLASLDINIKNETQTKMEVGGRILFNVGIP